MHFDQKKTVGALGTLIAAKWYRAQSQRNLLISLDSAETRRWMDLDDDARRADLLGLSIIEGGSAPMIDILEVKSGEDSRHVYTIDDRGIIKGKPVKQLINTGRSVAAIFGLNEWKDHVLTAPRREILRNHFYRQGLTGSKTAEEKQSWCNFLNTLFSGEVRPVVRLNLVVVNLGLNDEPTDIPVEAEGGVIRLVHLNEKTVSNHLGGPVTEPILDEDSGIPGEEIELEDGGTEPDEVKATGSDGDLGIEEKSSLFELVPVLREHVRITCGKIRAACQDFGIKVTEVEPNEVDLGPSIIRYKIKLAPGEDSGKLRKSAENIARQLAAESIPIIDFLPGTHYMYLDLARPDRQSVPLEPILKKLTLRDQNELPILVGVNPAGQPKRIDLGDDRLPHMLVAGGTGSGKTIFLYSVVLSLSLAHIEKTLEMLIIDPKQTDFTVFGRLKHLKGGTIITDAEQGVDAVRQVAENDMKLRSDQLQKAKCRDIKAYNTANPKKPMRHLVIVIDEYADLVTVLGKKDREKFEQVISRITARGRNVGIHLILATQRPTTDVVTGNIKANMSCRISFSLPSSRDSVVVLDEPGAERLLRNGDMLLLLEGSLTRLQGYYVDPMRIESLLQKT